MMMGVAPNIAREYRIFQVSAEGLQLPEQSLLLASPSRRITRGPDRLDLPSV